MRGHVLRRGVLAALVAGTVMGLGWMVGLAVWGAGFWQPLNLLAHSLWRGAPLGGGFDLGAAVLGAAIGYAISLLFGLVGFVALNAIARRRLVALPFGLIFGIAAWVVAHAVVWNLVDRAASERAEPLVLTVAHLLFGTALAMFVTRRTSLEVAYPDSAARDSFASEDALRH